ncbi:MAG: thermonuclease family protein [Roseofilum sp. SID3]|uniref:thermonuclease family protein n=1 Tax=Roseofilum sp. SID3 TaxID=2821499 RepID=UPI001B250F27|nr:thermonuclease family protein [Roseofilum sp. SID3]MBP0015356.1 thermonuclease family protein [Roseofilum sp. SID3]
MLPLKVTANVQRITDGDTLKAMDESCRCRWIDTPEIQKEGEESTESWVLNQWYWGNRSKQYLIDLIQENNNQITLYHCGTDFYGRVLSDWYIGRKNLQVELTLAGLAVPFLPIGKHSFYDDRETDLYASLVKAVSIAYREKRGFWKEFKDESFLLPYEFKKKSKGLI